MLVVTRKTEESVIIADNIEITVLEVAKDRVKLGIKGRARRPADTQEGTVAGTVLRGNGELYTERI